MQRQQQETLTETHLKALGVRAVSWEVDAVASNSLIRQSRVFSLTIPHPGPALAKKKGMPALPPALFFFPRQTYSASLDL